MPAPLTAGQAARAAHGFTYRSGPFVLRVHSPLRSVRRMLAWCYGESALPAYPGLVDLHLGLVHGPWHRRLLAPQVHFRFEGRRPFEPYPRAHAFPLLEWGTNWCLSSRAHRFLLLHAGALERDGQALLLPAMPGAGKSTLTAVLAHRGWRLLSDEFGLVDLQGEQVHPLPRAIPLKNNSIDLLRDYAPASAIGPLYRRTRKGDVAHLRPPADALARQAETARARWVLFPRYRPGSGLRIRPLPKAVAFTRLAQNSFNYRLLGGAGFAALVALIDRCDCFTAEYSDLEAMLAALGRLAAAP